MPAGVAPQHGIVRVLRGCALAAANAVLAVAAHAVGGGAAPDHALTVLAAVGIAAAGTALSDRQCGPPAMFAAVAVSQLGLHLVLTGLSGPHMATMAGGSAAGTWADGNAMASNAMAGSGTAGAVMTTAHAVAALITALLLAGAESALFAVAAVLLGLIRLLPPRLPCTRRARCRAAVPIGDPPATAMSRRFLVTAPHRGPPGNAGPAGAPVPVH